MYYVHTNQYDTPLAVWEGADPTTGWPCMNLISCMNPLSQYIFQHFPKYPKEACREMYQIMVQRPFGNLGIIYVSSVYKLVSTEKSRN